MEAYFDVVGHDAPTVIGLAGASIEFALDPLGDLSPTHVGVEHLAEYAVDTTLDSTFQIAKAHERTLTSSTFHSREWRNWQTRRLQVPVSFGT